MGVVEGVGGGVWVEGCEGGVEGCGWKGVVGGVC